ncbi:transcriptional regulator with XRE-family HTH domain [Lactobacillus colini]|uniref:Transcriptional regulator with XRE-family HTH domain n=1 Tax=Lactobacillus colini TaxID=1819254 RepID=A0ABS4MG95_9LACO|nr:helix-turn-helix transcriptional regulator [Lactobacillus colini]MBP2058716.1 transcriptional regulator with XRE-family HTH domain [Lactobacillus colini]
MTIGEALKEEQKRLGLTAKEMAAGIVSKSMYSKVINNKARLGADLLLKILFFHEIDIESFLDKTKDTYAPANIILEENLSKKIGTAFNNHDIDKVKHYAIEIKNLSNNPYLVQRAQIASAFLTNNLDKLDSHFSNLILKELSTHNNWIHNVQALNLFSNSMLVLPEDSVENQMKIFFIRMKRIGNKSEAMLERYAIVCSNYLHWKYSLINKGDLADKNYNDYNIKNAINFLNSINQIPHLMIYSISGQYYKSLFNNDIASALKIKEYLGRLGFGDLTGNWPV